MLSSFSWCCSRFGAFLIAHVSGAHVWSYVHAQQRAAGVRAGVWKFRHCAERRCALLRQAYLEYDDEISGIVRTRLKCPALNAASAAAYHYCAGRGSGPANVSACEVWDELELQLEGGVGDGAIFVPTRVQERLQVNDCTSTVRTSTLAS